MRHLYFIIFIVFTSQIAKGQKSKIQIAHNSVGKLQVSIANKEEAGKRLKIIGEGIKALEIAEKDKRTKNWPETWAMKAYLSSYVSILDGDENNAIKYFDLANTAFEKAKSLDKYQDNSGLIQASAFNINIKRQTIGNKQYSQNDFLNAYNTLKKVSDFLPTDTSIAINVAICAQNVQLYNDALVYFNRAKDNGVKNPLAFQQMANLYASKFESELAIKMLEYGLKLNPNHQFLTNDYINILLDNEKYDKALQTIETSLTTDKKNKVLFYLFGYLQQVKLKNYGSAELAYRRAIELDQNYFDALYQMSLVYIENANIALQKKHNEEFVSAINRAEFALLRAHEINLNDRNTLQLLIEIYSRKNRLDKVQDLKRKLNEF